MRSCLVVLPAAAAAAVQLPLERRPASQPLQLASPAAAR